MSKAKKPYATPEQLNTCAESYNALDTNQNQTFRDWAIDFTSTLMQVYDGYDLAHEDFAEDVKQMLAKIREGANWKGTSSEASRKNDAKTIILGYNGLGDACDTWVEKGMSLNRQIVLHLARALPESKTINAAIAKAKAKAANTGSGKKKTPAQKIGMGLGIIKKTQTNSAKIIAFRKELAALCKEHGIPY